LSSMMLPYDCYNPECEHLNFPVTHIWSCKCYLEDAFPCTSLDVSTVSEGSVMCDMDSFLEDACGVKKYTSWCLFF
jgi:hypothetical protein